MNQNEEKIIEEIVNVMLRVDYYYRFEKKIHAEKQIQEGVEKIVKDLDNYKSYLDLPETKILFLLKLSLDVNYIQIIAEKKYNIDQKNLVKIEEKVKSKFKEIYLEWKKNNTLSDYYKHYLVNIDPLEKPKTKQFTSLNSVMKLDLSRVISFEGLIGKTVYFHEENDCYRLSSIGKFQKYGNNIFLDHKQNDLVFRKYGDRPEYVCGILKSFVTQKSNHYYNAQSGIEIIVLTVDPE